MQAMRPKHPASQNAVAPSSVAEDQAAMPEKCLTTEELFGGAREIALLHNGRQYRLRITQQGKLLLTA
jgi:hemin uptake protein HemP